MELFDYLMTKKGHLMYRDLFSYLLGKNAGGSGTYTTFSGTSLNISNTIKAKIKNFMLNSTELTQDGTPTPDTPQDIHVITGSNNIKISDGTEEQSYPISLSSKNLFNLENENFIKRIDTTALSILSDGFTVNKTDALLQERITVYKQLKPNTTYTISTTPTEETGKYLGAYLVAVDEISTSAYPSGNAGLSNVATTNSYGILAIIFYFSTSLVGNYTVKNIQLEEGSTATTYEPYYNIEYCKIGDYADQIFKNTTNSPYYDNTLIENEWYLKKNINKVTFDGSDDEVYEKVYGSIYNNKCIFYLRNISHNNSNYRLMKSNRFIATGGVSEYYPEGINTSYNSGFLGLVLSADRLTEYSANALKTFFQNNNTDVYLIALTPTYIHISGTDYPTLKTELDNLYNNAQSYDGQTNITQTNDDLPFNLSMDVLIKDNE